MSSLPLKAQDASEKKTASKIDWQIGPITVALGDQAELAVPKGYAFADAANTRKFLESTENIPNGSELGTVSPANGDWFALFEFDPMGYVKDDEKDKLDADSILDTIKRATEAANEERKKRGWGSFFITGWIDPPHYDPDTHQLTWSVVGKDEQGVASANYRTRLLGRRGVMNLELVASPQQLNTAIPTFRNAAIGGFTFKPENKYSAYVKGDKVAEYGLTALIVGGATAAAVKTGFVKYLVKLLIAGWKLVVIALGALLAFLKRLFKKSTTERDTAPTD
jgi:uncharacterized membrane-anchored protein